MPVPPGIRPVAVHRILPKRKATRLREPKILSINAAAHSGNESPLLTRGLRQHQALRPVQRVRRERPTIRDRKSFQFHRDAAKARRRHRAGARRRRQAGAGVFRRQLPQRDGKDHCLRTSVNGRKPLIRSRAYNGKSQPRNRPHDPASKRGRSRRCRASASGPNRDRLPKTPARVS
jgi:hypothetical protein